MTKKRIDMLKRKVIRIILFFAVISLVLTSFEMLFCADSSDEILKEQIKEFGLEDIDDIIPYSAKKNAAEFWGEISIENIEALVDPQIILNALKSLMLVEIKTGSSCFIKMMSLILLAKLLSVLFCGEEKGVGHLSVKLCIIMSAVISMKDIYGVFQKGEAAVNEICGFVSSLIPYITVTMGASGNVSSATTQGGTMILFLSLFSAFASFSVPAASAIFIGISSVSGISENKGLINISSFLRNLFLSVMGIVFSFFSTFLSLQTLFSSSADGLLKKGLRLAVSALVPFVGSSIGEGLDTYYSCADMLKGGLGVIGVIIPFIILLPLFVSLVYYFFSLKICSLAADVLNVGSVAEMLKVAADALLILFGISSGLVITLGISMGLMAK